MKTLIILLLTTFAGAATAAPRLLIRGGAGAHFNEDAGFDVVSDSPARAAANSAIEVRVLGPFWVTADFEGSLTNGTTYGRDSSYDTLGLGLGATWRLQLAPDFDFFARGGAMARRVSFEIGAADGNAWTLSARGGAGLEYAFLNLRDIVRMGARVELTYELASPVDVVASGTSLGTYDPSGPAALLGMFFSF